MRCPAAPMCTADVIPTPWGGDASLGIASTIPVHYRGGAGECPASGSRILRDGTVHRGDHLRIQEAGAKWLRERLAVSKSRIRNTSSQDRAKRLAEEANKLAGEPGVEELMKRLLHEEGLPLGRPADQPIDNYFPGRPADVPEPGVGERPTGPAPWDLGGGFLGRAAVDNARDQLKTLVGMAVDQMASGQDTLARMTAMVDSVSALASVVAENLRAAEGLVAAAVGGDASDLPESATQLRAQLAVASQTLALANDGLTMAMRVKIEQGFSQIAVAIEAARQYQALP